MTSKKPRTNHNRLRRRFSPLIDADSDKENHSHNGGVQRSKSSPFLKQTVFAHHPQSDTSKCSPMTKLASITSSPASARSSSTSSSSSAVSSASSCSSSFTCSSSSSTSSTSSLCSSSSYHRPSRRPISAVTGRPLSLKTFRNGDDRIKKGHFSHPSFPYVSTMLLTLFIFGNTLKADFAYDDQ